MEVIFCLARFILKNSLNRFLGCVKGSPEFRSAFWGLPEVPRRVLSRVACTYKGRKKHINFLNINSLHPAQKPHFGPPGKKFMCLISWERTQKSTHVNFFGGNLGVKKGAPNGPFRTTKSLVYCFFLPLNKNWRKSKKKKGKYPQTL